MSKHSSQLQSVNADDFEIPVAMEAERSVLGALMLAPELWAQAVTLTADDFLSPANRKIFLAMHALREQGLCFNPVVLLDCLRRSGDHESVGGAVYVNALLDGLPLFSKSSDVSAYVHVVKERSIERRLLKASAVATAQIVDGETQAVDVMAQLDREMQELRAARYNRSIPRLADSAGDYLDRWLGEDDKPSLVSFHCGSLDSRIVGPSPGDLIIIGARTGVGKTVLALQAAVYTAMNKRIDRQPVAAFFSLEMSREKLFRRALQMACGFPVSNRDLKAMDTGALRQVMTATKELGTLQIFTDETRRLTAQTIAAQCHKLKRERGALDLVVIDYFGLLESATKRNNDAMELGEISRGLKLAAMELDCPFVVPCQLNREADGANEKPRLKHLRGTGSLEQDADLVIFLHRPQGADESAMIEDRQVIIGKQRDGWVGAMEGKFDKNGLTIFTTGEIRND